MKRVRHLVLAAALLIGVAACEDDLTSGPTPQTPAPGSGGQGAGELEATGPLLLIMDASNSMNELDEDGEPLIDGAKQALHELVAALGDDQQVGLRVYGHRVPDTDPRNGCEDTELVHPVSALDRSALTSAIDGFEAIGMTPIGLSLEEGAADLPSAGQRTIILVSDGLDTCAPPDPCDVAFDLTSDTTDFVIHTVGFALGDDERADTARDQLSCIAAAGGGEFEDAANAAELAESLKRSVTK